MNIRKYRWVACLLVCAMMLGMWNGNVARGEERQKDNKNSVQYVKEIDLTVATKPEEGKTIPSIETVSIETVSVEDAFIEPASIDTPTVEWKKMGLNGNLEDAGKSFLNNSKYILRIELKMSAEYSNNYELKAETIVRLNREQLRVVYAKGKIYVEKEYILGSLPTSSPTLPPTPSVPPSSIPSSSPSTTPPTTSPTTPSTTPPSTPTVEPTLPPPETPSIELPLISPTPVVSPTPPTYTLTLTPNKGTLSQQLTIPFTADGISKLSLPIPTRKGYKFIGWYDGKNRIEKITEAKDITLKAQWIKGSIDLKYQSVLKWSKYLDPDVKLTKITIEKKYTKHVKINQKKGTMEGKKYVKKAKVTLTINGKKVDVTVKRLSPKPKVKIVKAGKRIPYVIGIYRTFKLSYKYESGATRAVAEYSYKKKRGFKKCVKALNTLKGGSVSVKKGRTVYFRVTIYYGKWKSPKSELTVLKG